MHCIATQRSAVQGNAWQGIAAQRSARQRIAWQSAEFSAICPFIEWAFGRTLDHAKCIANHRTAKHGKAQQSNASQSIARQCSRVFDR
jgi:hypothetical protein